MNSSVILIIPTYNCETQILRVLTKSKDYAESIVAEVLLIDNKSQDSTIENAKEILAKYKIRTKIIQNPTNLSLGGSLKTGFLYAKQKEYEFAVILHGDDQASIEDLNLVFPSNNDLVFDFLIGARFQRNSSLEGYSLFRIIGNRVLNTFCSICSGRKIHDLIAGLNVYRVNSLDMNRILKFPNTLTFDAHLLLLAISQKKKIVYFPIQWAEADQVSNAKIFRQAYVILKLFVRYLFTKQKALPSQEDATRYDQFDTVYVGELK